MPDRSRQPDYDFFAPGRTPQTPGPWGAGASPQPFGGGPTAAPGRFDSPTPWPSSTVPGRPAPSTGHSTRHGRLALAAAISATAVAVAAWAVPAFRHHREEVRWEQTTVAAPASVAGAAAVTIPGLDAQVDAELWGRTRTTTAPEVRAYRMRAGVLVVGVAKTDHLLSDDELDGREAEIRSALAKEKLAIRNAPAPEGADRALCFSVEGRASTCIVLGDTAILVIALTGSSDVAAQLGDVWGQAVRS